MRRIVIAGVAAALALLATAPGAFGAGKLVLTNEAGQPVAPGQGVVHFLQIIALNASSECERLEQGSDTTNEKGTDKLALGTVTKQVCSSETSLGGVTKEVKLSAKGSYQVKAPAKLVFREPGPCVYDLSKMAASFVVGFSAAANIKGVGRLNKKASALTCPASEEFGGSSALMDESEHFLKTELRG